MTVTRRAARPLSLSHAFVGDVPLRDEREAMSLPLVSLSKSKRTKPIEWQSPGGNRWVRVSAPSEIGIATIWDLDVEGIASVVTQTTLSARLRRVTGLA